MSLNAKEINLNGSSKSTLPWWTWVLPFFIANLGTWLSLWAKTDPGASLWYLPTAFGIVMTYWWGPRALLGIYLNALICAPLWDLPADKAFLYALPETIEVALSWFFFTKLLRGSIWLNQLKDFGGFLLAGSVVPTFLANVYLVLQLYWLGDVSRDAIPINFYILFSADMATQFVFAIPMLVMGTYYMQLKGWVLSGEKIPHPIILPESRRSHVENFYIAMIFSGILLLSLSIRIQNAWVIYGLLTIFLAVRYGIYLSAIGVSWVGMLVFLLPAILSRDISTTSVSNGDLITSNLNILFLCGVTLATGRAITDLFSEIAERKETEKNLLNAENIYKNLVEQIPPIIYTTPPNQMIGVTYISPQIETLGYSQEEWIKDPQLWFNRIHPADQEKIKLDLQRYKGEDNLIALEYRLIARDGSIRWFYDEAVNVIGKDGKPIIRQGYMLDITTRKMAEDVLRDNEARYHAIFDDSPLAIWEEDFSAVKIYIDELYKKGVRDFEAYFRENPAEVVKCSGMVQILNVNKAALKMQAAKDKASLLKTLKDIAHPGTLRGFSRELVAVANGEIRLKYNHEYNTAANKTVHSNLNWAVSAGHETDYSKVILIIEDITQQWQAELALRQNEAKLRALFETMTEGVALNEMIYDENGEMIDYRILEVNPAFYKVADYSNKNVIGNYATELYGMTRESIKSFWQAHKHSTETQRTEMASLVTDKYFFISTSPFVDGKFVTSFFDITERKRVENLLSKSEERWQFALEGAGDGVWDWNVETNQVFYTKRWKTILGFEDDEISGTLKEWNTRIHPEDQEYVHAQIDKHFRKESPIYISEHRLKRKDGTYMWVLDRGKVVEWTSDGKPKRAIGTHSDITERKRAEDEIQRQNEYLDKLNQTTRSIIEASGYEEMMNDLAKNICGLMGSDDCYITHWDEENEKVVPVVTTARLDFDYKAIIFPKDKKNLTTSVLDLGTVIIVEDMENSKYTSREITSQFPSKSSMAIPLIYGRHKIGAIVLGCKEIHHFTERDIKNGQQVGDQVALAVWNAQQEYELQRSLKESEALGRITTALSESQRTGLHDVLDLIASSAIEILPNAEQSVIHLINREGTLLVPEAVAGFEKTGEKSRNMGIGDGVAGKVISQGKPIYIPVIEQSPEFMIDDRPRQYQSLLVAPIFGRNTKLGTISVQSKNQNAFNKNSIDLLNELGAQAAIAIENAWLYDNLQAELEERKKAEIALDQTLKSERDQRLLAETSAEAALVLTSKQDQNAILSEILHQVQRLLPGCASCIALVSENGDLRTTVWRGFENRGEEIFNSLSRENNVFPPDQQAMLTRKPVIIKNTKQDPDWIIIEQTNWINSHIAIPLQLHDELLGILRIDDERPDAFSEETLTRLQPLINAATVALSSAKLFESIQNALKETSALYRVSKGLATLDSDSLLKDVVALLAEHFGYNYVQILLMDEKTGDLILNNGSGEIGAKLKSINHGRKAGEGVVGHVIQTGMPFFSNDVGSLDFYIPDPLKPETKSEMAIPLFVDGNIVGVLDIQLAETQHFRERDVHLATAIAEQLSIALQKARLYENLQMSLEQEKSIRNQLLQNERLAIMGKLLASVSHELNNPLQAIQNALFLLKEEPGISPQGHQDLQIVLAESERMASLIDQLRSTYRPTQSEDFIPVDLNEVLEDVHSLISTHLRHNNVSYEFRPDNAIPTVPAIQDQIRQVLLNLMINAVEAMPDGGHLTVSTLLQKESSEIQIMVSDTGVGISPEIMHHIFDAFVTNKPRGTGLGLTITYDIITKHHGRIFAENNPEIGATFIVWLPLENREIL